MQPPELTPPLYSFNVSRSPILLAHLSFVVFLALRSLLLGRCTPTHPVAFLVPAPLVIDASRLRRQVPFYPSPFGAPPSQGRRMLCLFHHFAVQGTGPACAARSAPFISCRLCIELPPCPPCSAQVSFQPNGFLKLCLFAKSARQCLCAPMQRTHVAPLSCAAAACGGSCCGGCEASQPLRWPLRARPAPLRASLPFLCHHARHHSHPHPPCHLAGSTPPTTRTTTAPLELQ